MYTIVVNKNIFWLKITINNAFTTCWLFNMYESYKTCRGGTDLYGIGLYRSKKSCTEFILRQKKLYGIYIEAKKVVRNFVCISYIIVKEIQSSDRPEIFIASFSAPKLYSSVF